ncbi:MAG: 1-acyl-sn-glycerol-3-phosphate acyltransferase [Saprospiraceae bacterium]|nr:MAG: phospholipid/glycerol acyltransferase [Bacteroidetes bacterium OLB9]MCO6462828.1 1-acyl-sn-glycerol-3-phosphate acyltransferase [Saprospiraceae bacterium]MCZ2338207.1 1-acyl-sn-glycerol-3-phosphate acyltransferase [Chitinophagales bacterium]
MFYQFLKVLVGFALKVFFKRIHVTGSENIKNDRPQLIASNHPNGFMEPLVMACYFPKDLHFLVRGDVFDKSWLRPLLLSTHQIPIFRFKDGFSKLRENAHTIDDSLHVLEDNKDLLIFVEGSTESIKKLRSLQKGVARIAFQTLEKNPTLNLEIVPVGINFTFLKHFNEEVMVRAGKPILVKPYFEVYQQDKNKGFETLLLDLYKAMSINIVHIDDQYRLPVFEDMVVAVRQKYKNLPYFPVLKHNNQRLDEEIHLADQINTLPTTEFQKLSGELSAFKSYLKTQGISLIDLLKKPLNMFTAVILILGFIPMLIGALLHSIPILIGYIFTKVKVKQKEFKSSLLFVVSLVMTLLMYIIIAILSFVYQWPWWVIPMMLALGLWARYYHRIMTSIRLFKNKATKEASQNLDLLFAQYFN